MSNSHLDIAPALSKSRVQGKMGKTRFILAQLVGKDFKLRYRRSVLGVLWSVLNPLMMMLIMSFVFQYFMRGASIQNYPLYLIVGNVTFTLMSEATSSGLSSIIVAAPLLKKISVERWVFPVQKVLSAVVNFCFSLIAVVAVVVVSHVIPTWHIIWMFPALILLAIFCVGVSLLISSLAVFFRDMIHLWSVLITAWVYLTPIFWDLSFLENSAAPRIVLMVVKANPMYNYIEMMRCALVYQTNPSLRVIGLAAVWSVIALIGGYLVFRRTEHKFILFI